MLLELILILAKHLLLPPVSVNVADILRHVIDKEDICARVSDVLDRLIRIEQTLISLLQLRNRYRQRTTGLWRSGTAADAAVLASGVGEGAILIPFSQEFAVSHVFRGRYSAVKQPR